MGIVVELVTPMNPYVSFSSSRFDDFRDLMRDLAWMADIVNREAVLGLVDLMMPNTVISVSAFKGCLKDLDKMLKLEFERILSEVDRENYNKYLVENTIFDLIAYETRDRQNNLNNEIRAYSIFFRIVRMFKEAVDVGSDVQFC